MKKYLSFVVLLLFFTGCVTTQKLVYEKNGDLLLSKSKVRFPPKIGCFLRGEVTKFDKDGSDIGIAYNVEKIDLQVAATIYVYPAPELFTLGSPENVIQHTKRRLFDSHYEKLKLEIERHHKEAQLISERESKKTLGENILKGKYAKFEYEQFFAWRMQKVISELYLFQDNAWLIKYRITYPKSKQEKAEPEIQSLLKEIR